MARGRLYLLLGAILWMSWAASLPGWAAGDLQSHIKAARGYMEAEQWDYANYEWRNILSQNPRHPEALSQLGRSMLNAGMVEDAIRHLEQARKLQTHIAIDMALADAYAANGRYTGAQNGYRHILENAPLNVEAYSKLKAIREKLPPPHRDEAEKLLSRQGQKALGKATHALEAADYRAAARYLELASVYAEDERVLNNYGLSLLLTGNNEKAARTFYNLSRSKPDTWQFHANAAMTYLGLGQTYRARQELEQAIALCDDDMHRARLYNNLGYAYEVAGKPTYARFAYERAISMNPGLIKARMNLGYIFQRLMEYDNAIRVYKDLLGKQSDRADAWNQLGFTYELMHEPKKAIRAYKKAIAIDPKLEEAYFNLGTLYKKMDKLKDASDVYRKMVELKFRSIETAETREEGQPQQPRQVRLVDFVYLYFDEMPS